MRWRTWLYRVVPYVGRRQAEQDLHEELRLHVELERERRRDAGVPEAEASRAARRKLGNAPLIRERTRDVWGWRWLDDLGRDMRHAARGLRREPGFTATVVCVLALGIGANTAMFSIVYGMLLRPLPYPDSEAIVHIGESFGDSPSRLSTYAIPVLQEAAESFEQLAAYGPLSVEWARPDGAVTLRGATVSPSMFPLLRATPHLGRLFTEEEGRDGAAGIVLLSHRAWTVRFASDPDIVGTVLTLDDAPHTVIGVLAKGFYFPSPEEEIWRPSAITSGSSFSGLVHSLGRLRAGLSPERAATEVRTILQHTDDQLYARYTASYRSASRLYDGSTGEALMHDAQVIPLREEMVREYRPALLALTAAMALVLLIACSNVAGLLLARGVTRQRALAVCAALGAGRGRIVRQLLTESVVLSLSGGALGLGAAAVVLRAVPALIPGDIARLDEVGVDGVVLTFTLGLSVVVGLAFGAVPALQWSRLHLVRTLNEGSEQSTGGYRLLRSGRTRAVLAAAQVALALVLLVGAGLLLRSFVGLITIDRGYDPANVITARIRDPDARRTPGSMTAAERTAAARRFSEALLEGMTRVERLPNVTAVGLTSDLPLSGGSGTLRSAQVVGRPAPIDPDESPLVWLWGVSPGYVDVMRLRLRGGRFFTPLDRAGSPRVLVVNETFAREFFGGEPAVGQQVQLRSQVFIVNEAFAREWSGGEPWDVIGVVADIQYRGLRGRRESRAEGYVSVHQSDTARTPLGLDAPFIAVRTTGDPLAVIPFLREAVAETHPRASTADVVTMDARLRAAFAQPRFYAGFAGGFAALALVLAAFGIYGLLSYTVSQRRREIGVRMALGAQRGDIVTLVVRQGAALVALGAVAGLLAAAASSRVLASFLVGITTDDRLTFVGAPLVLIVVALVACWLPARRATRIDPMDALRVE